MFRLGDEEKEHRLDTCFFYTNMSLFICVCVYSPPLTQFFLDCGGLVRTDKKPALCKSYQKLVGDLWHKSRYVLEGL